MNSGKLRTVSKEVSWGNLQDQLAALFYSLKVIPEGTEIVKIKLDYSGGYVAHDKIIPVEIITKEE